MIFWTTFTPKKISWELTCVNRRGNSPSFDWQENLELIEYSLQKLKMTGISGIRLVIYPSEITQDGKSFDWKPFNIILDLSQKHKLQVDLCAGPFQYPNYPGIYLPQELIKKVSLSHVNIDGNPDLHKYGMEFLRKQMQEFGSDKRVRGFHLANEWPDTQKVEGRREVKVGVSEEYMIKAAALLMSGTQKPISLNTNLGLHEKKKVTKVFGELLKILSDQGKLGFDIYPTQDRWKKNLFQSLRNRITDFPKVFKKMQKSYPETEIYFAEIEAQPWGSGKSWYQMIKDETDLDVKVHNFYIDSLDKTYEKYIKRTGCETVSLWGSDFWIAANLMGVKWPLSQVRKLIINS
jgi:hypothetical protein